MFKRILVPLDGSNLAEKVLPFARYLAERLQATLILFHVVEKDAPNEIHGQHHLREVAEARAYLDQMAVQLSSAGVSIMQDVHEVQEAGVAQTIRDHAEELQADLIVLCAHGNGGLRDMIFGSIAQQVIRQGTVPVLFIRPGYGEQAADANPIHQILAAVGWVESARSRHSGGGLSGCEMRGEDTAVDGGTDRGDSAGQRGHYRASLAESDDA